jgi:hypothetical protein
MPHLPPAHHETSKRDCLNETKIKEKQNETVPDSNSNLTKSMTHHNQTKELTTWFLNPPLMSPLTTKAQSLKFKSKTPWSTARRTKNPRKAQECYLEEGKQQKPTKGTKSGKAKQNGKKSSKSIQKLKINTKTQNQHTPWNQLPLTLSMEALPHR